MGVLSGPLASRRYSLWAAAACIAVVSPTLIAYHVTPSVTFFNEDAAFAGWGLFLLVLGASIPRGVWPRSAPSLALLGGFGLLLAAVVASSFWASTPWSISLSAVGTIAAAMLAAAVGGSVSRVGLGECAFRALCVAFVVAGVASSGIGLIQVFLPSLLDRAWLATLSVPGHATGNMRQPNLLSSLLVWSIIAAIWLVEARAIRRRTGVALALMFLYVVVLTGSRTGALELLVLMAWGASDRSLSRYSRWLLLLAPAIYGVLWGVTNAWAYYGDHVVGGSLRLTSSGRFVIWSEALSLIASHPWFGVGFGQFNFAWTLTPFPGRDFRIWDHTHNLLLNLAVEIGIPLTLVLLGLLFFSLWHALRNARKDRAEERVSTQRAALVLVLTVGVHSLLEYPLWYAYFLLPAAFSLGLCLERPRARDMALVSVVDANAAGPFVLASIVVFLGSVFAYNDYRKVAAIHERSSALNPIEQRIAVARSSVLFAHHADYATAMGAQQPAQVADAFARASHSLLDAPFMLAWARSLYERGEIDKARYVAQRLKEFRRPEASEFFAPCAVSAPAVSVPASGSSPPFQCLEPTKPLRYEDFR